MTAKQTTAVCLKRIILKHKNTMLTKTKTTHKSRTTNTHNHMSDTTNL